MSSATAPQAAKPPLAPLSDVRQRWERVIQWIMEGLLLFVVFLSPWSYGAVHPGFEFLLDSGIALLLLLWAARILISGQFRWQKCPVALCLAALFVTAVWQLVPWSSSWLATLSPRTAELYRFLLPAQPESLAVAEGVATHAPQAGSTLSLCPGVTQREALRYLAIFLVFALVRNNLASSAHLKRLSIVVFANGLLLSLFGLMQYYSYGWHAVYGINPTEGSAFGPFICRNHFPYYVNICLGLGMGLLLASLVGKIRSRRHSRRRPESDTQTQESAVHARSSSRRRHGKGRSAHTETDSAEGEPPFTLGRLLNRPYSLALSFAVTILVAGIIFSASRGGGLAMLGGLLVCVLFNLHRVASSIKLGVMTLAIGLVTAVILLWVGLEQVQARWEQLIDSEGMQVGRLEIWSANLPSFKEFPLWGTGYGSFEFTELLRREKPEWEGSLFEHAHNDYLEVLLEGGIAGMIPVLLFVGLLFWYGYRAIRRQSESSAGWLATGAFFGLTALAIHSFVDFGLHIPAIAFLATVLCAHLVALGSRRSRSQHAGAEMADPETAEAITLRWGGVAPLAAALVLVLFAWVLVQQGWLAHKAERLRAAATQLVENVENPDRTRQIAYLKVAVGAAPRSPNLRVELARAQLAVYLEAANQVKNQTTVQAVGAGALSLSGGSMTAVGCSPAVAAATTMHIQDEMRRQEVQRQFDPLLLPALASYLVARDLCPIMTEPQLRIAASADKFKKADNASAYLERARFLSPANPTVWYLSGRQELQAGNRERAWRDWRHSLELSDLHLVPILDQARALLSTAELIAQVLPDKPRILYEAAMYLKPEEDDTADRRPFLQQALSLIAQMPEVRPEDKFVQALAFDELGQKEKALEACRLAVQRVASLPPNVRQAAEMEWRLEYVRMLVEDDQPESLHEAQSQLEAILVQHPSNSQVKQQLSSITTRLSRLKH